MEEESEIQEHTSVEEQLNTESETILGSKSDNPKAQEIPTKDLLTEEEPEVEIIKEKLHSLLLDSRNKFLDSMKDEKIDEQRSQYNSYRYNSQGFLGINSYTKKNSELWF